jgi:hypothetical protein
MATSWIRDGVEVVEVTPPLDVVSRGTEYDGEEKDTLPEQLASRGISELWIVKPSFENAYLSSRREVEEYYRPL